MDGNNWPSGCGKLWKWGEGKPIVLTLVASQIAGASEETYELVRMCRDQTSSIWKLGCHETTVWLKLYDDCWCAGREILVGLGASRTVARLAMTLLQGMQEWSPADREELRNTLAGMTWEQLWETCRELQPVLSGLLRAQIWDLADCDVLSEGHQTEFTAVLSSLGAQFFFTVGFPCWILTGQLPHRILQSCASSKPDTKNLDVLFRLDRRVMQHPVLDRFFYPRDVYLKQLRRIWLARALRDPIRKVSRKYIKYRLARLIYELSQRLAFPLKTPEIKSLFDIVAEIRTGEKRDADFKQQPGAFLKANQRGTGVWDLPPQLDKSSLKSVRALREALF